MQATSQPTRLGQYEIRATLALGPIWRIYKAFSPNLHCDVALKVIAKDVLSGFADGMADRFRGEASAAANLDHPGIVKVYEYGEDGESAFVATEYMQGWRLREQFRVPRNDAVNLITQLLEALDYAHQNGIVHRAINPSNLLLSPEGQIRVCNFGVVRLGTGAPSYLAPEQLLGLEIDRRCDIFSCGVIFYELLTGASPFPGAPQTVAERVRHDKENPPSDLNSSLSHAFDRICAQALAKSANERYAEARSFRDDVRRANLEAAAGVALSPLVSNETIVSHASFKSKPESDDMASARKSAAAAPSARISSMPIEPAFPPSRPSPVAGRAAMEPESKGSHAPTEPAASAAKKSSPDLARLEELLGKSPDSLAGYCEDAPCPPERVIHAFVATVQALIAQGPANCSAEALFPQNIHFDVVGRATILSTQSVTQTRGALNSPRYAAPEMISEKASAGDPTRPAPHIYALGMMFYEILLGRKRFEKAFSNQHSDLSWLRWQADLESKAAPLKSLLPECPIALSDLLESMMEKHAEKRQADLNAILSQLKDIARRSNRTVVLRKPAPARKQPAPTPKATAKKSAKLLVMAIFVVACGAILFVWQDQDLHRQALSLWTELIAGVRHLLRW